MANLVFNNVKGKVRFYTELPAANDALLVVLLKATGLQSDDALQDYDTLSALLAAANDECDFTNYTRKTLAGISAGGGTVDDINNWVDTDANDFTYTAAGGASNNGIGKALVCYDPDTTGGDDTTIVPLTMHDFVATTDGNDLVVTIATGGFFRAANPA